MSAFLKLNKQDAYITPYTAFKSYTIASESFSDNGIEIYYGENSPDFTVLYSLEPTGEQSYINGYHRHVVYRSIDQLYFSNYSSSEASGSFENFRQTTLHDVTRSLEDKVSILSIPKERYGSSIRPGTFVLYYDNDQAVIDNKEGQLIDYSSSIYLGEIIYPHGIAILTNPDYTDILYKTQTTQSFSRKVKTDQIAVSTGQLTTPTSNTVELVGGQTWSSEIIDSINAYNANLPVRIFQDGVYVTDILLLSSSLSLGGNTGTLVTGVLGPYTASNPAEYTASYYIQGDGFNIDLASGEPAWPSSSQIINTPIEIVGQGSSTVAAVVDANTILVSTYIPPFPLNTTGSLLGDALTGSVAGRYTSLNFDNQYDIFTHYYHCKVSQNQLSFSQNPTTYTNLPVSGSINDNITGSYFQPYVTTIGLYNDMNELIAVGKLGQPIPKSQYTDTTFVVRLDM